MRPRLLLWLLLLFVLLAGAPVARAAAGGAPQLALTEWTLPNGLRVIYAPHRAVPAVTVQVWYHVGSKDERPSIRGVAHLFEHMMFKGSDHVPPEQHARLVSALGGTDNAFTSEDVTAYHQTLPRRHLEFAMRLEADRMRHLRLTSGTINSEREVVKEEKRLRLENSPIGRGLEALRALAFTRHPYSWTPAGDIPDLDRVTVAECRAFYATYYVPNNATLVVVGDVSEAEVRAAAQRQFGVVPRGREPPRVKIVEPPQTALREKRADWPSELKVVLGAYHIPAARHADLPALKVLSALLSAGQSSRLNQALVRKGKLALSAGGFVMGQEHPGLFLAYALGLPTHDATKMKERLLAEVEQLARVEPTAQELAKVRNQVATSALTRLRTLDGLANEIGRSTYVSGDPRAFLAEPARLDRVTAADVQRVARTYLVRRNLTLVLVGERPAPATAVVPAAGPGGAP